MPELRFTLTGHATKKNHKQVDNRPSAAFEEWEAATIRVLRQLRRMDTARILPLSCPCTIDLTVFVKGPEGDAAGYVQAVGDVLDGTKARNAHRKKERQLKVSLPFSCDYQIVTDDKLFNKGVSARVLRDRDDPRVEVKITWE